ncbi:MAG TPA: GFA family protein [Rhodopila sp.]|nr:GFA family protein [Rhodopila sp.]
MADVFEYALNCHCSQCRRATGAAFKPIAGVRIDKLRITSGSGAVLIHGDADKSHDVHCSACGSLLYSVVREGAYAHVTMGTLVDTPSIRPSMHIFVGSKAPWFEITDNLPQFDAFPDS